MHETILIQDREELFYLLSEAAEFEHTVMCSYLYAMWSLKQGADEGITAEEARAIDGWRRSLRIVALEEMLHLSLVNNLLAATGAAAHFARPEFPVPPGRFPSDVVLRLSPFSEATLDHFMFIERPEEIVLHDGAGFDHPAHHPRVLRPGLLSPMPQDYASQGQLYHGVLRGLAAMVAAHGEDDVFIGHGEAQVGEAEFGLPGLFKVTDLASARRAVEEIVMQGEGAPAHREGSHYQRFAAIREELTRLRAARPDFVPARPVIADPVLSDAVDSSGAVRITDPLTSKVVDLGNAIYALMVRTFVQVFAPAPLPRALRQGLAQGATELMYAMSSVGEAVTRLPADPDQPGRTAGLSFALPLSTGQLVQSCAAQILAERANELASAASRLDGLVPLPGLADQLTAIAGRFTALHDAFEGPVADAVDAVACATPRPVAPAAADVTADDPNVARTRDITLSFDTSRCIHSRNCVLGAPEVFAANVQGAWLHPENASVERCVAIAHGCPSGAITYVRHDGGPQEGPPAVNALRLRENGPYAVHAEIALAGHGAMHRATLCRCGQSANKPFCDNSHLDAGFAATGEPASLPSEPLAERAGTLRIEPTRDGPLVVQGVLEICTGTGRTVSRSEGTRLCRCGGSSTKPFCDGTHAIIGFRSEAPARPAQDKHQAE